MSPPAYHGRHSNSARPVLIYRLIHNNSHCGDEYVMFRIHVQKADVFRSGQKSSLP